MVPGIEFCKDVIVPMRVLLGCLVRSDYMRSCRARYESLSAEEPA